MQTFLSIFMSLLTNSFPPSLVLPYFLNARNHHWTFFNSSSIINQQPSLETTLVNHIFSLLQDIRHWLSVYFGQGPINSDSFHIFIVQFSEDSVIRNLAYQNWWRQLNIDCPPIYFNQYGENVLAHPDSSEYDSWNLLGRTVVETQQALVRSISILTRLRLINSPTVS